MLSKSRKVLDRNTEEIFTGWVVFNQLDEEDPTQITGEYQMPLEQWDDFGRPDIITVTIEPGDQLNNGED